MSVFAILFWCWLTVSVVVLVQRRVRRRAERKASDAVPATTQGAADHEPEAPSTASADADPAGTASGDEEEPATSAAATPDRTTPTAAPDEPGPAPDVRPPATPSPDGRDRDITEALTGIHLPCDLAPLTIGVTDLEPDHVDLVTTGVGPDRVGRELSDELERLGYDLSDLGGGEYLARRGETVLRMKIHDRPAAAVGADGRGFATAPPDGLVVELTLT